MQVPTLNSLAPFLNFPSFVIHLPTKHVGVTFLRNLSKRVRAFQIGLECGSVSFWGEDPKTRVPGKTSRRRETTTNSTYIWRRRGDFNPVHIGGRPAWLSPPTAPTLPLISKVLHGIYMRFTRGTYFISKALSLVDLYILLHLVGYCFLAPFFCTHHCLGSRTLHGLSTYICYCIMYIVHHIIWTLSPVCTSWYLHLKVADQHFRSFVW